MENTQLLIVRHWKKLIAAILVVFFLIAFSCSFYGGIKGTVLDNVTGKPIEGAVVVSQWTKERGIPGMRYHKLHKITETLTDKNGKFTLSGTIGIRLEPPEMIIYRDGYIPWRNDMVYPGGMPGYIKNNEWHNWRVYRLDTFIGGGNEIHRLSHFTSTGFLAATEGHTPIFREIIGKLTMAEHHEIQKLKKQSAF